METHTSETLGWMKDINRGRECAAESYLYQGQGKVKLTDVQEVGISGYRGWGSSGGGTETSHVLTRLRVTRVHLHLNGAGTQPESKVSAVGQLRATWRWSALAPSSGSSPDRQPLGARLRGTHVGLGAVMPHIQGHPAGPWRSGRSTAADSGRTSRAHPARLPQGVRLLTSLASFCAFIFSAIYLTLWMASLISGDSVERASTAWTDSELELLGRLALKFEIFILWW